MLNTDFPCNTRLHEDHVFGCLTLDSLDYGGFLLQYSGWKASIHPQDSSICVLERGTIQNTYFMERIALPFLRLLQGCVLLHASAVSLRGRAFGLLAVSGVGKSTLAAGFMMFPEFRLIADDIVAIQMNSEEAVPFVFPFSTQIAMRHDLFDCDEFVSALDHCGYKKLLTLKEDRVEKSRTSLQGLIFLDSTGFYPPSKMAFSQMIPTLLKQQMAISNPPAAFTRQQFHGIMSLHNIPCYKMGISCKTRSDIEASCRQFFSLGEKL